MGKVIGIDLGTTNSCVAFMDGGQPKVIPNKEGGNTTPSVVAFTNKGEILVGTIAKRQAITNPENTIYSVKRFIGAETNNEDAKKAKEFFPYKVEENSKGYVINVNGKQYTPQEISAIVLIKLKEDAEAFLGENVTDCIITVPAYFNDSQRQATKDAGTIAGLNVLRIINEPTSASLAYNLGNKKDGKIIVIDIGGGTSDISILDIAEGVFEVKATNGDVFLGGDNFDEALIKYVIDEFKSENNIDLKSDKMALQRIKEACENAKKELSSSLETDINLPFITADNTGAKHLTKKITRAKYEQLIEPYINKIMTHIDNALKEANYEKKDIDDIVMVGGSTRTPIMQEKIKQYFSKELNKSVNPDEVVALGASVQGAVLTGDVKDVLLLDVIPLTLSIETLGGVSTPIIEKGTTIPARKSQTFSTAEDNQPAVTVHVVQGEREFAKDNKSLGNFTLEGIAPAPKGVPQIEITFDVDANGIVNVSAKDKNSGKENKITISGSSNLSKEDVERMIKEAQIHKSEDEKRKEFVNLKNEVDSLAYEAKKNNIEVPSYDNISNIEDLKRVKDNLVSLLSQKQSSCNSGECNSQQKKDEEIIDAEVE